MRYHSQNLTADYLDRKERSIWLAGRAWLRNSRYDTFFHWEWSLFRYARGFAIKAGFGYGESDRGILLHVCVPFLFSVYLVFERGFRCKECETGIAIHNGGFWVYPLSYSMEWCRKDPWWRQSYCWHFPWELNWWRTDVLTIDQTRIVWHDERATRKSKDGLSRNSIDRLHDRMAAEKANSITLPYRYTLKNGEVQSVNAEVHVSEMEWRARWWPVLRNRKVCRSIGVNFSSEVGEETGSWKGGCVGCGYDLHPGEAAEACLRRMERERKF